MSAESRQEISAPGVDADIEHARSDHESRLSDTAHLTDSEGPDPEAEIATLKPIADQTSQPIGSPVLDQTSLYEEDELSPFIVSSTPAQTTPGNVPRAEEAVHPLANDSRYSSDGQPGLNPAVSAFLPTNTFSSEFAASQWSYEFNGPSMREANQHTRTASGQGWEHCQADPSDRYPASQPYGYCIWDEFRNPQQGFFLQPFTSPHPNQVNSHMLDFASSLRGGVYGPYLSHRHTVHPATGMGGSAQRWSPASNAFLDEGY